MAEAEANVQNQRLGMVLTALVAIITSVIGAIVTIQVSRVGKTVEKIHVATNSGRTEILKLVVSQCNRIIAGVHEPSDVVDCDRAKSNLEAAEMAQKVLEAKQ